MNNLFVLHTQYNLMIALATIQQRQLDARNDLILFHDFIISDEMMDNLKRIFHQVTVYEGSLKKEELTWKKKALRFPAIRKDLHKNMIAYDGVYLVEDSIIPELFTIQEASRMNPGVQFYCIGDGAENYFSCGVKPNGLATNRFTRIIRDILFRDLMGIGEYYHNSHCFGTHPVIQEIFELYPDYLRYELAHLKKCEITGEALKKAIRTLYAFLPKLEIEDNAVILMLDRISVYPDRKGFEKLISDMILQANLEQKKIYYKYHPREDCDLKILEECVQLDRTIPAEYVFSCGSANSKVVGIMTTSLQTAKKMGYEVESYIKTFCPEKEDIIDLYKKIGIEVK